MAYNNERTGFAILDLETVPSPRAADLIPEPKAPANYKDEAKIAAYKAEAVEAILGKAALEPDLCEIVCLGVWSESRGLEVLTRETHSEAFLLGFAESYLRDKIIIGYNLLNFDLPVLYRRAQILGVPMREPNLDRYRTPHIDLLERLSFRGRLTMRGQAFYRKVFDLPTYPDPIEGKEVYKAVAEGRWADVAAHCGADVLTSADLAARLGYLTRSQPEPVQGVL
jgi:Predicted 3'-5' exonuclease related to the exonuclease domain of PolB